MEYECDKCFRSFKGRLGLDYHVKNNVCCDKKFYCEYCGKGFAKRNSMYRHTKHTCKKKKEKDDEEQTLKEQLSILTYEYKQMKHKMSLMEKKFECESIHFVKDLNVNIGDNQSIINKTINNVNNGTVNNYYLVGYGKENYDSIKQEDLLKSIKMGFNSTLNLIDTVHFNPRYPEFHNVYISSMKNKYAMMYDGNDWTLVMKDDLIDKMYDDKRNYIEENLDDFLDSLTNSQRNALHRWMNVDDDHPYIKKIKNDIKLLLYNKRRIPLDNNHNQMKDLDNIEITDLDNMNIKVIKVPKHEIVKNNTTKFDGLTVRQPAGRPGTKRKITRAARRR